MVITHPSIILRDFFIALSLDDLQKARNLRDKMWKLYRNDNPHLLETWEIMQERITSCLKRNQNRR